MNVWKIGLDNIKTRMMWRRTLSVNILEMLKVLKDSKIFLNILKNLNILELSLVSHKPNHSLEFYGISKDVNIFENL